MWLGGGSGRSLVKLHVFEEKPKECHFFPGVLEDEGVVVARATEEVGCPDHGDVLQTHLGLLDVLWLHKVLERGEGVGGGGGGGGGNEGLYCGRVKPPNNGQAFGPL